MNFETWMQLRGLSPSSVKKYADAVAGPLSDWARQNGILEGPLTAISSHSRFQSVAKHLRTLPIYLERNKRGHSMYNAALEKFSQYLADGFEADIDTDIETIVHDPTIDDTERTNFIKCRVGQGIFRQRLIAFWGRCSVTGFTDIGLLVASHVKPWRASNNTERLCQFNGLLLVPNLDAVFDKGFVTFDTSGLIAISPQLSAPEKLGVYDGMRVNLTASHQPFMDFHRAEVFRDS